MPTATETIALERQALMRVMDTQPYTVLSRKLNENLIIASWNIKHFSNRHTNRASSKSPISANGSTSSRCRK